MDLSHLQHRLENPLWAIALGIAAFTAGCAVWLALWQVWTGLVYIGGIVHLCLAYQFLFVRTPMQRAISFGLLFASAATLAYRIVPQLLG